MSQIVFQTDLFAVFKVKVTVKDSIIKVCLLHVLSELLILLQLNLVLWYIIIRWIVLWKDWIALFLSRSWSQKRFRIPVNVHLDNISSAAEPSVTKLCMMIQHVWPKCSTRGLVAVFKLRVTVRDHLIKYDCFCHICWTPDLFATKFNWMVHLRKLECFM